MHKAVAEGVVVHDATGPAQGVVVGTESVVPSATKAAALQQQRDETAQRNTKAGADAVEYVCHSLGPHDEIGMLAIRYGSSIDGIMRANGLLTRDLDLLPVSCILRIPRTHEKPCSKVEPPSGDDECVAARRRMEERDRLLRMVVRDFATNNGCSQDEAKFYLEEHEYDVHAAEQSLSDDRKWERSSTGQEAKRAFKKAKHQPIGRR